MAVATAPAQETADLIVPVTVQTAVSNPTTVCGCRAAGAGLPQQHLPDTMLNLASDSLEQHPRARFERGTP